ncbi:STAS domain-containing protein [Halobacillus locisalis]|uniref:STAS domain-containing protein n=1 Tax=Halobacillus locisalis TaxID=220753 RepID=A0A838CRZ9_9BACI|nr:STAS domain-containing protein [Halobacillus locisalis]MBA2174648.1 STAS domain-containing protein [Halobacillus locisalis]
MSKTTTPLNHSTTIRLEDQIHVQEAAELRETLLSEVEAGRDQFVLDLSRTTFLDSAGLGVLVTLSKRLRSVNGTATIVGASKPIRELFDLTKISPNFKWK